MMTIKKSVTISAPVTQVFDFVTHPQNLPAIWPALETVSNVKDGLSGAHSFDWVYRMAGLRLRGHSETVEVEKDQRSVTRSSKGLPSTFKWTFVPAGDGTELTLEVLYDVKNPILRALALPLVRRSNERQADTMLANLKLRMETLKSRMDREEARVVH